MRAQFTAGDFDMNKRIARMLVVGSLIAAVIVLVSFVETRDADGLKRIREDISQVAVRILPQEAGPLEQNKAEEIVKKILYIKDRRTNLCFAHISDGDMYHSGPSLAAVPCESIPWDFVNCSGSRVCQDIRC